MRRVLAGLAVVLLCCLLLPVTLSRPAAAADPDPVADGSRYIGACLQSARSLSALFVFDRSGSLKESDPKGIRYDGLAVALDKLSQLTRPDGEPLPVEVAISAFDDRYDSAPSIVDWTGLNDTPDDRAKVISKIVDTARADTRPRGNTDFEQALQGGFSEFADRGGDGNCRVMLWFTDGEFTDNPLPIDQATAQMCAAGGLLDQIRAAGIVVVGLQLQGGAQHLKPMSLGAGEGVTCGTQPRPEGAAPGIYLRADDTAGLQRIFGQLNNIVQGCTPAPSGVIDPGVNRIRVTINTAELSNTVRLDAPGGTAIAAGTQGETHQNGYQVQSTRDDSYVSMDVVLPMGAPAGEWKVTPDVPVQPQDVSFCVFSDLHLAKPTGMPRQEANGTAVVTVQVVDRDGNPAAVTPYAAVTPAVAVLAAGNTPARRR